MKTTIPHSQPTLGRSDVRSVEDVLQSKYISQGKKVEQFENKLAKFVRAKGAVATSSGTAALHLALLALGAKKGDEVIIPTYVCTALLNAVMYTGAKPRLADVNYHDGNISLASVMKKLTKKTKAIVVPHMFGYPADLKPLLSLGVPVIEDCAHSIGALYDGKRVGQFGHLSIFSFYATKMMATGEGGMVVSSHASVLEKIRDMREYDHKEQHKLRFNYKMTDMEAALGINQLKQLPAWIKKRRAIAKRYNRALKKHCIIPVDQNHCQHVYYRYVVKIHEKRDAFRDALLKKGIHCAAPIFRPIHRYLKMKNFVTAEQLVRDALSIPIYPSLTEESLDYIIRHLEASAKKIL